MPNRITHCLVDFLFKLIQRRNFQSVPRMEMFMKTVLRFAACIAIGAATVGCATVALAPGAEQVRITKNAADVASCMAVGNVRQPPDQNVDMRNLTVGVGGDTLFVTESLPVLGRGDYIKAGVAYRCSK
jgi:hypothetical protein